MDDRIVAWKLCHVVHKVLREGHPLCLVHSQRHRKVNVVFSFIFMMFMSIVNIYVYSVMFLN